jgi:hypothetical protein
LSGANPARIDKKFAFVLYLFDPGNGNTKMILEIYGAYHQPINIFDEFITFKNNEIKE